MMNEQIATILNPVLISGRKSWEVLEDWLDVVEASLTMLPLHACLLYTSPSPRD